MTDFLTLTRDVWRVDPLIPIFCGLAALIAVGVLVQLLRLGVLAYGRVLGNRRRRRLIIQRMEACAFRDPAAPRLVPTAKHPQAWQSARRPQMPRGSAESGYQTTGLTSVPRDAA